MRGEAEMRRPDGRIRPAGRWWIVAAVLLTACRPSPQASDGTASFQALCAGTSNSYECAQAIERQQLRASSNSDRVTRRAGALDLRLQDGRIVSMADAAAADDPEAVRYSFREYLVEIGYFVLHRQFYEGEEYVMVHDRTGRESAVPGVPLVSPDGARIVATAAGLSGGYGPNVVEIWLLGSSGLEKEHEVSPTEWEPVAAAWVDAQTIRLETRRSIEGGGDALPQTQHLRRRDGRWLLDR